MLDFILSTLHSFPISMKLKFSPQIFEKSSKIKFHENPSSWSRNVPCGRRETDGQPHKQADMEKLIVALRSSATAPRNINNKCWLLPGKEGRRKPTGRSDKPLFLLDFLLCCPLQGREPRHPLSCRRRWSQCTSSESSRTCPTLHLFLCPDSACILLVYQHTDGQLR